MQTKLRQAIERKLLSFAVDSLINQGYRLSVSLEGGHDTEDMKARSMLGSVDRAALIAEAYAGDECHVFVSLATGELLDDGQIVCEGWLYFVWGNDGWDCLSDYATGIEGLLKPYLELAEYAEKEPAELLMADAKAVVLALLLYGRADIGQRNAAGYQTACAKARELFPEAAKGA